MQGKGNRILGRTGFGRGLPDGCSRISEASPGFFSPNTGKGGPGLPEAEAIWGHGALPAGRVSFRKVSTPMFRPSVVTVTAPERSVR